MTKIAVIKTGGKQYLISEKDELFIDLLNNKKDDKIALEALAVFDPEKQDLQLGTPLLKEKIEAQLVENAKGDKIRIARFKSKNRYRRVRGFRSSLSKIKITKI